MSGDYVQRGTPAFMPKRIRAEMALRCGAGAVFELPVCYATGSAEYFALGAVSLLDRLGIVDCICFGSECDDLKSHAGKRRISFSKSRKDTKKLLRQYLKEGKSFPAARQSALSDHMGHSTAARILRDPNNILGIE